MPTDKTTELTVEQLDALAAQSTNTSLDYAEVDQILRHVPALCATVRHLLSENERLIRERNEALDQCTELHRQIAEMK